MNVYLNVAGSSLVAALLTLLIILGVFNGVVWLGIGAMKLGHMVRIRRTESPTWCKDKV